jgi:hypothetical protein
LIFTWEFLFEFTILAVHPLPYMDVEYDIPILDMLGQKKQRFIVKYMLSDFIFAFMFLRVYFVIRTLMNFCPYSEMYSKRICAKYGFEPTTSFCLKALIKKQPGTTILVTSVISILWLSYVLRIFER